MIWFSRSDSRLTMFTRCFSSSSSGISRAQFLYRSGHCRQRLADLVRNRSRQASHSGHALFGRHFLFQTPQFGQVLEIENIPACAQYRLYAAAKPRYR